MSDKNNQPDGQEAQPSTPPASEPETFPREYVQDLRKEAAARRDENNKLKQELEALKGQVKTMSEPNQLADDLQKVKEANEALQKQLAEVQAKQKQTVINSAVKLATAQLGIVDAEAAVKLADFSGVDAADDPEKAVLEALQKLTQDKPYLVKPTAPNISPTNPAGSGPANNPLVAIIKSGGGAGVNGFGEGRITIVGE